MPKPTTSNEIIDMLELSDAYKRYKDTLIEAGMDEESAMFLLGRLASEVQDQILKDAMELTKDDKTDFENMEQGELTEKLNEIFEKDKGLDLKGYADFLAEQKVREFENLGDN